MKRLLLLFALIAAHALPSMAAWSLVQTSFFNCGSGPLTSCTITIPAPTPGNLLVMGTLYNGVANSVTTATGAGTWVHPTICKASETSTGALDWMYNLSATSGTSITLNYSGNVTFVGVQFFEYSGTGPFTYDTCATTSNSSGSTTVRAGLITTTGNNDLAIAGAYATSTINSSTVTPAPWVSPAAVFPNNDPIFTHILGTTATTTQAVFSTSNVVNSAGSTIAFTDSSSGGGGTASAKKRIYAMWSRSDGSTSGGASTTTYSVAGAISGLAGNIASVAVSGSGGSVVSTDTSGNYSKAGLGAGTYTLTPSLSGYTFSPTSLSATITSANVTGKNFTATAVPTFSISGTISGLGGSIASVAVSGQGSVLTDSSGNYSISSLSAGSYTLTPSLLGYTFSPTSLSPTITSANVTAQNFTASTVGISTPAVASAAGFNSLTFDDEFNSLDLATDRSQTNHKWYPAVFYACPAPSANMTVSAGVLDLKWTYGQGPSCGYNDTNVDTSIMTHNQTSTTTSSTTNGATFKYGYFEARMKSDVGNYMWPAFWLDGQYGQAGSYAELDISEVVNADGGIHMYGTIHNWPNDSPKDGSNLLSVPNGTDFSQFHTYGFLWTSTQLKWYFDGALVRTATPPDSANSGPPLYLLLSQQVGQNWSEGAPSGTPAYNNYVDYVRVWQ